MDPVNWKVTTWSRGLGVSLTFFICVSLTAMSEAQGDASQRNTQGPVSVTVALVEAPGADRLVKVSVALDTHSVSLDSIKFEETVRVRTPEGAETAPVGVEQAKGSGHHRQAVLVFPAPAQGGELRIVVKDIGGVPERAFLLPLPPAR